MRIIFLLLAMTGLFGCASKKYKDVSYLSKSGSGESPKMNIFVPKHADDKKLPVLIFVHGGNWNTGSKNQYGFFGRNFAKKDIVTIIPDYTLSPNADYDVQARQVAEAIRWAKKHAAEYGGDANQLFITGHSAGGHLIALAAMNPKYGIDPTAISGIILNDAAGLDMKHYLEENPPSGDYLATWTNNPENWKDASPIYFLNERTPPFLIYVGKKTYESIKVSNERFLLELNKYQPNVVPIFINKKHVPMILQYIFPWSDRFDETAAFIKKNR